MLRVAIPRDAAEVQVQITGENLEPGKAFTILCSNELQGTPSALRLIDICYAVETGLKIFLWWEDDGGDTLILPLEGRGRLDLGPIGGIHNPRNEGWTGNVQLSTKGSGLFFLGLEFAKLKS